MNKKIQKRIAEKRKEFINEQQNSYAEISKKGESDESDESQKSA